MKYCKARPALALLAGLGASMLAGCQKPPHVPDDKPPLLRQSSKAERQSVAVTIYNQDFGVVRETRRLKLGRGRVELSYRDVSAQIQPETVRLHSLTPGAAFEVLEQNYRYDLLTPAKLLEKYVGKRISVYRYNEKTGSDEKKSAEVLSVEGGATLRIDGEVTTNFQGRFAFPNVPANLLEKPTLVWLLKSDREQQDVEVTYLTRNLNWRADYVLKLDASDGKADLNGWVTLDNRSGSSYENAALRLVAGDVNRQPRVVTLSEVAIVGNDDAKPQAPQFRQENLFEYHLYSLERPTSILDNETKQVALLSAEGITVRKKLVFRGEDWLYRTPDATRQPGKVGVFVELVNSEKNRLGMPLPQGTVRIYKADTSGALQFLGEDAIDHTPRDERVELKVGEAFDIVGEHVQKDFKQLTNCSTESAFEVELRNHKASVEQVEVVESPGGDWEILQHSQPFTKVDAHTLRFDLALPAHGVGKVSYRVRVRFC